MPKRKKKKNSYSNPSSQNTAPTPSLYLKLAKQVLPEQLTLDAKKAADIESLLENELKLFFSSIEVEPENLSVDEIKIFVERLKERFIKNRQALIEHPTDTIKKVLQEFKPDFISRDLELESLIRQLKIEFEEADYKKIGVNREDYLANCKIMEKQIRANLQYAMNPVVLKKILKNPLHKIIIISPEKINVDGHAFYNFDNFSISIKWAQNPKDIEVRAWLQNEYHHAGICEQMKSHAGTPQCVIIPAIEELAQAVKEGQSTFYRYEADFKAYLSSGVSEPTLQIKEFLDAVADYESAPHSWGDLDRYTLQWLLSQPGVKTLLDGRIYIPNAVFPIQGLWEKEDIYFTYQPLDADNVVYQVSSLKDNTMRSKAIAFFIDWKINFSKKIRSDFARGNELNQIAEVGSNIDNLPPKLKKLFFPAFCEVMAEFHQMHDYCDRPTVKSHFMDHLNSLQPCPDTEFLGELEVPADEDLRNPGPMEPQVSGSARLSPFAGFRHTVDYVLQSTLLFLRKPLLLMKKPAPIATTSDQAAQFPARDKPPRYDAVKITTKPDPLTGVPVHQYIASYQGDEVASVALFDSMQPCSSKDGMQNNLLESSGALADQQQMSFHQICRLLPPTLGEIARESATQGSAIAILRGSANNVAGKKTWQAKGLFYVSHLTYGILNKMSEAQSEQTDSVSILWEAGTDTLFLAGTDLVLSNVSRQLQLAGKKLEFMGSHIKGKLVSKMGVSVNYMVCAYQMTRASWISLTPLQTAKQYAVSMVSSIGCGYVAQSMTEAVGATLGSVFRLFKGTELPTVKPVNINREQRETRLAADNPVRMSYYDEHLSMSMR